MSRAGCGDADPHELVLAVRLDKQREARGPVGPVPADVGEPR